MLTQQVILQAAKDAGLPDSISAHPGVKSAFRAIYAKGQEDAMREAPNPAADRFAVDGTGCAAGVKPCVCALAIMDDAARYRFLRDQDVESKFPRSGVFIGRIPSNDVLTGDDADYCIDAAIRALPILPAEGE